jgi:hypothetical protein
MARIHKLLVLGAALVIALPAGAQAQLDADDRPTTRGPIASGPQLKSCKSESVRGDGGRILARFRVCSRYYLFNPEAETDDSRNYGAFWIQVQADATRGVCVKRIKTKLAYSRGVHAKAPKTGTTVTANKRKRYTTKLTVDAQGNTDTKATIRNSFVQRGGRMSARTVKGGDYLLEWKGSAGKKLGFAAGLELSWPDTGEAPRVRPRIRARLSRNC